MTGKRGPAAVLAIGVRQQSVYQRKTLLERRRHRMASVPAVSFTRPGGIWKMSVLGAARPQCTAEVRRSPQFYWVNVTGALATGSLSSDTVRCVP
jgi:hypothetical protein